MSVESPAPDNKTTTSIPATSSTPAPAPQQAVETAPADSRLPNDIDDPTLAPYCAEMTNVPTRGSIQGGDYFWTDGAIDITGRVSNDAVSLHLRWRSKLTTEPKMGEPMRSDRYSYMTMELDGELVTGTATPARFKHGGGGSDCTPHFSQGGDASGGTGVASTLTLTTRTDTLIEGTLDVPTEKGVQRLAFRAPIVPEAPAPAPTKFVCCLAP